MTDDRFGFLGDVADEDETGTDTEYQAVPIEDDTVEPAGRAPDDGDEDASSPPTRFNDMYEFMNTIITPVFSRKLSERSAAPVRWDPDWWRYPEAVLRADLMWRTFEVARAKQDPNELEAWLRVTVDHHMGILLNGTTGPMHNAGGPQPSLGGTYPPEHDLHTTDDEDSNGVADNAGEQPQDES